MRFLRTNTAVMVTVGPFYDKTDGVTIETALTITNERITLTADTDAGSAPTNILDNVTGATSATANDLNYITGNDAGLMQLELAAADVNRLGRMFLSITDAANHCPVFHEFMVLPAMIYDAFVLGTDVLDASMTQILGTAVSTPATAGILDINVKNIDNDAASASGTVTFPNATLASTANITAGTITTVTNLTNAPTAGDLTATMKTSVTTAATAATPVAASVSGAVGSVTGNVGGNVVGTVGSVVGAVGSVTGSVGGNVTGSAGSVVGAVGSVTGNVGGNVTGSIGSLGATAKSDVNAEVLDVLNVDTHAEPGQEAPGATITWGKKLDYVYKFLRNKVTQTSTTLSVFADDAVTVDQKAAVSDNGTTYTRGEIASGP